MRILIATGIFPPDIGGPAQYAKNLVEEFSRQGHHVKVLTYKLEKKLPSGIRHFIYFLQLIFRIWGTDLIIALDSFSVGLPAVLAAKIFNKKIIIRLGGDFLWENYVEKTGNIIAFIEFYKKMPELSLKQKIIFFLTKFVLQSSSAVVFSAEWQRNIFQKVYNLEPNKLFIIENYYGEKIPNFGFREKNFLWAGRPLKLKNLETLKMAFSVAAKENGEIKLEISGKIPHEELIKKIQTCYVAILPSISDISPNFIIDAVRANKPFILTKETGLYEKLKNIGIFVDPFDKDDIKKKILFLADSKNYEEYKNRVANFNFIHSWQKIAEEFLSIYKNL
jgi:glycosyltransferase involved in cell wall biosynthesis